jgi:hypothetical protein
MVIIPSYLTIYLRCSASPSPLLSRPLSISDLCFSCLIFLVSVNSWTRLVWRRLYRYRCTTVLSLLSPCFANRFAPSTWLFRTVSSTPIPHSLSSFSCCRCTPCSVFRCCLFLVSDGLLFCSFFSACQICSRSVSVAPGSPFRRS